MAQKKTSSLALTEEDRALIGKAKSILEREHKGATYSLIQLFRVVLNFFVDAKSKKQPTH